MFDVLFGLRIADPPVRWGCPVMSSLYSIRRESQGMRGRQALNVAKSRGRVVVVQPKQQKIANRRVVQLPRYKRVHSNAVQRVAENKNIPHLRVVKRLDSEMIARTKQFFLGRIPDRERKIPPQVLDARCAPRSIGMQNQLSVGGVRPNLTPGSPQFGGEVLAAIDSCVRDDPKSPVETRRLIFGPRFARGLQHCMTQTNGALQPARLGIGATVGERIHLRLQKRPLNRRTVPVEDADDAAQSNRLSIRVAGVSNGEKGCCTASSLGEKVTRIPPPE